MNKLLLFDVDGTIAVSGQTINEEMSDLLHHLHTKGYVLGIVGGGNYAKICHQLHKSCPLFTHIFAECGCVYYLNTTLIHTKNIRTHPLYPQINILVKKAMEFISQVDYTLTGHFIDLRTGIIYISLIGMQATEAERKYFMDLDKKFSYRKRLLEQLQSTAVRFGINDKIDILEGGSVGISVYPSEWNKSQVIDILSNIATYDEIHYFGDKYKIGENDYDIINHSTVIGHPVNSVEDTINVLKHF